MLHRRPLLTLLALAMLFISIDAFAQIDKGSVEAVALDQSKAALPGVTVALSRPETGYEATAVTDTSGVGTYSASRFVTCSRRSIGVNPAA